MDAFKKGRRSFQTSKAEEEEEEGTVHLSQTRHTDKQTDRQTHRQTHTALIKTHQHFKSHPFHWLPSFSRRAARPLLQSMRLSGA